MQNEKKDNFLANTINEQRFIIMLATRLTENSYTVVQASDDADVKIVQTAGSGVCKVKDGDCYWRGHRPTGLTVFHVDLKSYTIYFRTVLSPNRLKKE